MALGPRAAHGLCCISRPKHHAGSGPLSSNVRRHTKDPRRIMRVRRILLFASLAASVVLIVFTFRTEEITAEATASVPLYDATTVAGPWGTKLVTVGALSAGDRVQVAECRDRKSDIELLTVHAGVRVVIAGDSTSLKLRRRNVAPWSEHATNSCRGLFESMSVASGARQLLSYRGDA
jgi:hypothetical protein